MDTQTNVVYVMLNVEKSQDKNRVCRMLLCWRGVFHGMQKQAKQK